LYVLVADTWGRNVAKNVLVYDRFNNIAMGRIRDFFVFCLFISSLKNVLGAAIRDFVTSRDILYRLPLAKIISSLKNVLGVAIRDFVTFWDILSWLLFAKIISSLKNVLGVALRDFVTKNRNGTVS